MTLEELKVLGEKVANGTATPAEKFSFIKELNTAIEDMRKILKNK